VSVTSAVVVAFAVTAATTPVVIAVARSVGIVDRPGALKPQSRPVPYLGGVAVVAGTLAAGGPGRAVVVAPVVAALALGVADDRFDLPARWRLAGEVAVGAGVAATCPVHLPGVLAAPLVAAVTVVLINGVNLLDGLDLLATGVAAVAAVGLAVEASGGDRVLAAALAAALAGFALYNRPPARVYLGDGGSYALGTLLAVLTASAWAPGRPAGSGVVALAVVVVPAAEIFCAVTRRYRGRQPLLAGDRGHPYDRLVARGWPRLAASGAYVATEVVAVVAVVVATTLSPDLAVAAGAAVAAVVVAVVLTAAALAGGLAPDPEVP
jgi:UDP-GlcNAc:undecaprenyl-phosphate GlcNAc-1-phosphate transferase